MKAKFEQYYTSQAMRHYMRVVAFAVCGGLIGGYTVWLTLPVLHEYSSEESGMVDEYSSDIEPFSSSTILVIPASEPTRIRIPKIKVDAVFEEPLGVDADRAIEVPEAYETVGWYKYGPTPGELGPAVVLGHVDSYRGPAVFYGLGSLEAGDKIFIDRVDGSTATFTVETLERHTQDDFPTKKVYGDLEYAGLRLITCTGTYNRGIQRYTHNLIVFARLSE